MTFCVSNFPEGTVNQKCVTGARFLTELYWKQKRWGVLGHSALCWKTRDFL